MDDTELLDSYFDEDEELPPLLDIEFPQPDTSIPILTTPSAATSTHQRQDYSIDQVTALPSGRKRTYAKLDAERLLGDNGLLLLKTQGPKLKFKGRRHEVADLRKFLNFYQLWGHQLFPKMKFQDLIEQTESVCRKGRCKVALNAWVDEYHQAHHPSKPAAEPERNSDVEKDTDERNGTDNESENGASEVDMGTSSKTAASTSNVQPEQTIESEVDIDNTKADAWAVHFSSGSEISGERPSTTESEVVFASEQSEVPQTSHSIFTFEDDDDEDFGFDETLI